LEKACLVLFKGHRGTHELPGQMRLRGQELVVFLGTVVQVLENLLLHLLGLLENLVHLLALGYRNGRVALAASLRLLHCADIIF